MKILNLSNWIIKLSFYALFFLVPLVFWKDTSELYELNKMWLTFILTLLILAGWGAKSIVSKKFYLQRTPLDIPIAIFLVSQVLSTIFSWDSYVSLWGYYSRFNGGLFSITSYILLYYALVSNFDLKTEILNMVKKLLVISLVSGAVVALWGLPSHFGYDPTCLIFRGSFDVSCWTADFQPKIRIFSTLGQPAWLGAYLAILIPLLFSFFLNTKNKIYAVFFALLSIIFYADILFTRSRGALLGFWVSAAFFGGHFLWNELKLRPETLNLKKFWLKTKPISTLFIVLLLLTAVVLNPIEFKGKIRLKQNTEVKTGSFSSGGGGTESGKIRLYVWQGALNAWIHNPVVGTGVETFAFAYYKYKPVGHNLTSEWNFLYNKAHNEYLNYLATSGILGLGSYLFLIYWFFRTIWKLVKRKTDLVIVALVAGYISILITNFFGFSVVIVNLYFFLIPAFVFIMLNKLNPNKNFVFTFNTPPNIEKLDLIAVFLVTGYLLLFLRNFWLADLAFANASNLIHLGEYSASYTSIREAVRRAPFEPTYKDELAGDDALFAVALLSNAPKDEKSQKQTVTFAQDLAKEAIDSVEQITRGHPNNVTFLKTKVRVYYTLSQIDPKYTKDALSAIKKAQALAPSDANIYYNLGLLYGQNGETQKAVDTLKQTIKIKPNYANAYYALGLFYRQMATDKNGRVIDEELNKKAIEQLEYILKNIDPKNQEAKDALEAFQR